MREYSVLIIDDDIWMQRILSKTLKSYGFRKTLLASNGFEGIAQAVEYIPSLIILDLLMPELTGHTTLKILKHIKKTKEIPVLVISALSDVENVSKVIKIGTAGFISKPFTRTTVYDKLIDVFGRARLEMIAQGETPHGEDESAEGGASLTLAPESPSSSNFDMPAMPPPVSSPSNSANDSNGDIGSRDDSDTSRRPSGASTYKEEDSEHLESIKKMLLKNRR